MEKILALEVIERIIRMELFLDDACLLAPEPNIGVIDAFKRTLDEIKGKLWVALQRLREGEGPLQSHEYFSCVRRILQAFESLDRLHLDLGYVSSQLSEPTVFTFITGLFKLQLGPTGYPKNLSLVPSDVYNFEEVELSSYLRSAVPLTLTSESSFPSRNTIFLPKIEIQNPLAWPILAHEVAHTLREPLEEIYSDSKIEELAISAEARERLISWTEQVYCDLIASRILGPAYLCSFVMFVILGALGPLESSTKTDPYPRTRLRIMTDVLESKDLRLEFGEDKPAIVGDNDNIVSFCNWMFEERSKFERQSEMGTIEEYESEFPMVVRSFRTIVSEKVEQLPADALGYQELRELRPKALQDMVGRLERGVPISSFRPEGTNISQIDTELNKLDKLSAENKATDKEVESRLAKVLSCMREEPSSFSEITNAGWLYKVKRVYPKFARLLFSSDATWQQFLETYKAEIARLDDLLGKSIQTAFIHRVFSKRNDVT